MGLTRCYKATVFLHLCMLCPGDCLSLQSTYLCQNCVEVTEQIQLVFGTKATLGFIPFSVTTEFGCLQE